MDTTFRIRRWYRNQGLVCLPGFLAWGAFALWVALTDPDVRHRAAAAAVMGGIPLSMAGLSLWLLATCWRQELTVRGDRIGLRGVIRRTEIDLRDVAEARWRTRPNGGNLLLRDGTERLSINFGEYEDEGRRVYLVHHLRSALPPEVQTGWDLFEYRYHDLEPRPDPLKPGPDEILVGRGLWARLFIPALLVVGVVGVVGWWRTGEWPFVGPLVGVVLLWALMHGVTPVEGMVVKTFSALLAPDSVRFVRFLLLWLVIGIAGVLALDRFGARLSHPDAALIVGGVVWLGVLLIEAGLQDRRQARRDREAADLAAKARGEARPETWPAD